MNCIYCDQPLEHKEWCPQQKKKLTYFEQLCILQNAHSMAKKYLKAKNHYDNMTKRTTDKLQGKERKLLQQKLFVEEISA